MAVDVQRVHVVCGRHEPTDDHGIVQIGLQQRCFRVAVNLAAEQARGVAATARQRFDAHVDRAAGGVAHVGQPVVILDKQDQLAKAAVDFRRDRGLRVHVHKGAGLSLFAGVRVQIARPRRFRDQRAKKTVPPGSQRRNMVMKIGRAKLDVGIPAIAHEFRADDFAGEMIEPQGLVKDQRVVLDLGDATNLKRCGLIHADADQTPGWKRSTPFSTMRSAPALAFCVTASPSTVKGRTDCS